MDGSWIHESMKWVNDCIDECMNPLVTEWMNKMTKSKNGVKRTNEMNWNEMTELNEKNEMNRNEWNKMNESVKWMNEVSA